MTPAPDQVVVTVAGRALGVQPAAEVCGVVTATGSAAGEWMGKRVVVPRLLGCGDCDACRRGRLTHCAGLVARSGFGATGTAPSRWLCSLEPPLWSGDEELWRYAALADAALAPYTALARAGVGPGDRVVVVGRDARARFALGIAAAKSAEAIADHGAPTAPDGATILATTASGRKRALELCPPGGTVVFLDSAGDEPLATDWPRLVAAEARILGVVGGHPDLLPELAALVARGQLPLAPHVRRVGADEVKAAHDAYLADGGALPILVP